MSRPLLVGITGGIGSGKSTVSKIFGTLSVPVYYADDRGKALLIEDQLLIEQVISTFGKESYGTDGELNTQYLARQVFPDPEQLEVLNSLVHPAVARDFEAWVERHNQNPYVLKEAALLYEAGSYKQLDATICVMAPQALRLERVLLRDPQRSRQQVEQIMARQTDDQSRKELSDYRIQNDGANLLIPQVRKVHKQLLKLAGDRA